jgi:ubiquinone/menaquinone biosynthesis C-methylase UbiE
MSSIHHHSANFQELTLPEQASIWENWTPWSSFMLDRPEPRVKAIVESLGQAHGKKALEIGPGRGRNLLTYSEHDWRVHILDWTQSSLTHCKELLENAGKPVLPVKGDFRRLPYDNGMFHLVVATSVLQHARMQDFQRAMGEIKRTLASQGVAIISLPTTNNAPVDVAGTWVEKNTLIMVSGPEAGIPHHFFTEEELQPFMKRFRSAEIERVVEPYPPGKGPLHANHQNEWFWLRLVG